MESFLTFYCISVHLLLFFVFSLQRGECISSDGLSTPWAAKLPGTPTSVPPTVQLSAVVSAVAANVCPDKTTCDDKSTCCQLVGGDYGCCPMVKVSRESTIEITVNLVIFASVSF